MPTLINDPALEERLIAERAAIGANHHDEVWEGVYMMTPAPANEHQKLVHRISMFLDQALQSSGGNEVLPGVDLSNRGEDWEHDFRVPDIAVFLSDTKAENHDTHWRGAADFLVEIVSPGDRTYEKIPYYSRLGVRELLTVDRDPWTLELYRHDEKELPLIGQSTLDRAEVLSSKVLSLAFRFIQGEAQPRIEISHPDTGKKWLV